jgi:two-component system osmolarity sensor histidine kinase EnvZ
MRLAPASLLWRTFLLIAVLMLMSVLAWFSIFTVYEREPRARQLAQTVVSVVNLTRTALINAREDARVELLRELSDREGIHIYPAETTDRIEPLPDREFLRRVQELVRRQIGADTRMTLERQGERALFVSFSIEGDEGEGSDEYWLALPPERLERHFPLQWLGWGSAVLVLALAGAWSVVFLVTRPLKALENAAAEIGRGRRPAPVAESGPSEIRNLARNFNQMNADLGRLDEDRALILAGISHDLRTPLARLRMGIEMVPGDETTRDGMVADVEEMDRTIGQFLDFARAGQTEGNDSEMQATDITSLLIDLTSQYRRRSVNINAEIALLPPCRVRPQALRRAVGNLIDNALRYAGNTLAIDLTLKGRGAEMLIEVADHGPGIPEGEIERLKLPFTRLETARSNALGAGLGLAIVDRFARNFGGRLELSAREGGGLVASIFLPLGYT